LKLLDLFAALEIGLGQLKCCEGERSRGEAEAEREAQAPADFL